MQEPRIPDDEAQRLALLAACNIMYTPSEAAFDDVARLAAEICGTEIALITLVDADVQWFKARVGVEQTTVARDLSFCGHCIHHAEPMIVEDTLLDPRFTDNPLVTGAPHLRFYCGVPLEVEAGSAIGALSVADRAPRTISPRQVDTLRRLASQISRELRLRRDLASARIQKEPDEVPIEVGTLIGGRWRVARELGRGAVGAVYEVHGHDGERAAIKVLLPMWSKDEAFLERFAREARVLMRLRSPHVGKLLDVGNLDDARGALPYLVLEFLEGIDLDRMVVTTGRLNGREALAWCADACDGVAEAHELGVVHRDLKPSNLFLANQRAAAPLVKVLDFGLAAGDPHDRGVKLTRADEMLGSPAYMAPEQMLMSSDVDARTDVWGMGAVLYEVLTAKLPFDGGSAFEVFANALSRDAVPVRHHVPGISLEVEEIVATCLQRDRARRYPSMQTLSTALRVALT